MKLWKMVFALCLCGVTVLGLLLFQYGLFSSFGQEDLEGKWYTSIPAAERVEQSLLQFGISYDIDDELKMTYEFHYQPDGTLTIRVEDSSAQEIADAQVEALRDGLPELLYYQYQAEANLSREDTDAMLAAQGLTMESLVEQSLSQIDFKAQFASESMILTQYYCVKNGKLCYASDKAALAAEDYDMTVEPSLKGDTLILDNAINAEGEAFEGSGAVKYPLTLTR